MQRIQAADVPVAVYVWPPGGRAASAGTFITMAGHLAVSASGQGGLLVRCDPKNQDALQQDPRVAPFVMHGRPMTGWVHVDVDGAVSDEDLDGWLGHGLGFARSLPPR